jgi:hypothetical protein
MFPSSAKAEGFFFRPQLFHEVTEIVPSLENNHLCGNNRTEANRSASWEILTRRQSRVYWALFSLIIRAFNSYQIGGLVPAAGGPFWAATMSKCGGTLILLYFKTMSCIRQLYYCVLKTLCTVFCKELFQWVLQTTESTRWSGNNDVLCYGANCATVL